MRINKYERRDGNKFNVEAKVPVIIDQIKQYFSEPAHKDAVAVIGISGGKDSSVCAALLVKALGKDRVIGVKMPQGEQYDIECANNLINVLGIKSYEINIGNAYFELYRTLKAGGIEVDNPILTSNTPARIRMTTLYAIASTCHGRVINTCNLSEDYVGYATKFGDAAGDFSILNEFTVSEVKAIGHFLGLPHELVEKVPEDGLSGLTDEANLGFTYSELDNYLRTDTLPESTKTLAKIKDLNKRNLHKLEPMQGVTYSGHPCYEYSF